MYGARDNSSTFSVADLVLHSRLLRYCRSWSSSTDIGISDSRKVRGCGGEIISGGRFLRLGLCLLFSWASMVLAGLILQGGFNRTSKRRCGCIIPHRASLLPETPATATHLVWRLLKALRYEMGPRSRERGGSRTVWDICVISEIVSEAERGCCAL